MLKSDVKFVSWLFIGWVVAPSAHATDVTSWTELKTNKDSPMINITADIATEGSTMPISFTLGELQTFEGNGHSINGAYGSSFSLNNTADIIVQNFGSYSDGTAGSNTFSYTNLDGDTVYKTINKSVNSFATYLFTRYKNDVSFTINNSVFEGNGGRIVTISGSRDTLNLTNSIFYNNTSNVGTAMISGNATSIINVSNSIFYNNSNTSDGGAISTNGTVAINNAYFVNNSSTKFGGALNLSSSAVATIDNARFEGNVSAKDGGAICMDGNTTRVEYIKNSQFINNRNTNNGYDGGAISTTGIYIETLENVLFEGNFSSSGGGGLWGGMNNKQNTKGPVLLKNVTFKSNEAGQGGGYYSEGSARQNYTYITDSEFSNNTVTATGHYLAFGFPGGAGLINTGNVPMVINNTTFDSNTAVPGGSGSYSAGGGAYFAGKTAPYPLKVVDSTFTNNSALEGAALFVDNADTAIIADTKDVVFSGNVAGANTDTYNGGDDIYFQANTYGTLSLNAAANKKVVFNGSVAAYTGSAAAATMNINNSGITYNTYDGTTETPVTAGTSGEIQFNNKVGDEEGNIFDINLYGGKLSIGQTALGTNPDGLINNNNFIVAGDSTLNTANGVIGEFAPQTFTINAALQYEFDIDLAAGTSDKLVGATNNGSLTLSTLNIITDVDADNLKVTYSDTNINGVLKDGYVITTSTASYDVTAGNDTSSYILISKKSGTTGGLPEAIQNGSSSYSITSGADEVVTAWSGTNALSADLTVNGNNQAIKTENGLNGIDVGSSYTLTMNNVSDMTGFNYAISNAGTVNLNNTTIHDSITNNGTLEVNSNVSLGAVSGTGITNINADHELTSALSGNTVNVNNATLSGVNNLASDVNLTANGGVIALGNQAANVNTATFDANSTLSLTINSTSDHGSLTANTITVADGAKLEATLGQGIVSTKGSTQTLQLLSASNADFDNFAGSFDNNMYHFEKADSNGNYNVTLVNTAEDVVESDGGQEWVAEAAKAYIDGNSFNAGSVSADIADQLAALAQNDSAQLIEEIKALAPTESAVVQDQAIAETNRLFKTVDSYLRGERDPMGMASGDIFEDVSVWAKPYIGQSKVSNTSKIIGQKSKSKGVIAGLEKKVDSTLKVGVGLHYDETDIDALRRDISSKTMVGFIYGEYKPSRWFVNAVASYGQSDWDEYKYALGKRYTADYDVHTASVAATVGYQLKHFTPEVSMHYYNIRRAGYTDTAEQHVHASTTEYVRATAGVRFMREYGIFTSDIYVGLGYDVTTPKTNTLVSLNNATSYVVDGERLSRLEYELNVGVNAHVTDKTLVGVSYMGAYRSHYQEHAGIVRVKYEF